MFENYWNTRDIQKNFPAARNLGELIDAVSQWAKASGRVVCSVTVNGLKLTENEETKFSTMRTNEIQEFRIESQTPENLLDESLIACQEHLVKLIEVYEKCSYLFRAGDISYASRYYTLALTGIYHFVDLINNYAIVFNSVKGTKNPPWLEHHEKLLVLLNKICSAYELKDYHLVADLIEYDFLELLEIWKNEIIQMSDTTINDGPTA